jgi:gliding motility-associated-like protein
MKNLFIFLLFICISKISTAQMVTSVAAYAQSCDCYTITDDVANIKGGVFSPNTIDLNQPFNFTFTLYLGNDDPGADGVGFVLQQNNTLPGVAWSAAAAQLGFGNIVPSLAIEIDTYNNGAAYSDIAADHVTFIQDGNFTSPLTPPAGLPFNIEDNATHVVNIIWDPVLQIMSIFIDGSFVSAYNGDIINTVFGGNPNVYFGWSGATGGLTNLQTMCIYRTAAFTPDKTNVCIGETVTFTDNSTSDLGQVTYLWDFGDGTTSTLQNPTHSWTTSGTKPVTLTVTDISGCTDATTINITVNPPISTTIVVQDVSCMGSSDGIINTTPTNGIAPYSYNWDIPSTAQNPTGLSAGVYNLTITDGNGCTGSATATINNPPTPLSIGVPTTTNASCGTNNGSITINPTGGWGGYTYALNGGTPQVSNTFTGLTAGNYNVSVIDQNGCVDQTTVNVALSAPINLTVTTTDATCGTNNGSIIVTVNNGSPNYTYTLNTGATSTVVSNTYTFSNLSVGTYDVTVIDGNSCSITQSNIIVNNASAIAIDNANTIVTDVSCNGGSDGSLNIAVTGGQPTIQYSIDGGVTYQTSSIFSNLTANTYTVTVLDGNSCSATSNFTINEPPALVINSITVDDNVHCNGSNEGQVTVNASGGSGTFLYSLDGGATTQSNSVFSNLTAGNYTLTLIDANTLSCSTTLNGNFTITEPNVITITTPIIITDATCDGSNDGSVTVSAQGGTPPYTYSLNNGPTQTQNTFNNLNTGSYTVEVSDFYNCPQATQSFSIGEANPFTLSIGAIDTTICYGITANLCASLSGGGTPPFNYTWNGTIVPLNCVPYPSNNPGLNTITLSVSSSNGCTTNLATKNVTVLDPLTVLASTNPFPAVVCEGETVQLNAEATGGNPPYNYTWTNDINSIILTGAIQDITPTTLTNYTVTASDGCTIPDANATVQVDIYNVPTPSITANPQSGCTPLITNISHDLDPNIISSQTWSFENGETSNLDITTQTFTDEGCTDINFSYITTDGCPFDTTLIDYLCVYPFPIADFDYSPEEPDILDTEVDFNNLTIGGYSYLWTFGTGDSTNNVFPTYTFPVYGARDYDVWLYTTNTYGCRDSIMKTVHITELPYYYIPNTFTPEGNNLNELFKPVFIPGFIPHNYTFTIFNRWGEVIYQTNDIYSAWDGVYNGVIVEDGTYLWQIRFTENETDRSFIENGTINVIH